MTNRTRGMYGLRVLPGKMSPTRKMPVRVLHQSLVRSMLAQFIRSDARREGHY